MMRLEKNRGTEQDDAQAERQIDLPASVRTDLQKDPKSKRQSD